jgi:tetratricopeptide (TPR) repeat protein
MFGLFENKRPKLTITEEDKSWVEDNLLWLGRVFGIERMLNIPFIYPYREEFPYKNLRKEEQFVPFFKKLCTVFEVNPDDFESYVFNVESAQWEHIIKANSHTSISFNEEGIVHNKYTIHLNNTDFETIERTVAVVVKHLAIYKLVKGNYYEEDNDDIVALTIMYFGFGIFLANGNFIHNNSAIVTSFPEQVMAYTNALICFVTNTDYEKISKLLNGNTKLAFRQNYLYLRNTNNTLLDKATINENIKLKELYGLIDKLDKENDFNAQIVAWDEVLKIREDDWIAWNNLGYAKLMLGRFEEAEKDFNKSIICDNHAAFPFNNRAFCRLQLGDLERAFSDIISSLNFDDKNAYAWRTLGIYHFLKQEYKEAAEYLEKALAMNKTTDLIHFYLAKLYEAMSDNEKQAYHKQKSIEANETNEDFIKNNRI